jgi:serine/threonine-protein kinase
MLLRALAAAAVLALVSCGASSPPPSDPVPAPVATVGVTLASGALLAGTTTQASAVLRDSGGNVLTGRTVAWASSASGVATVSPSGVVTAVAAGSTTITATSEGVSGSAPIAVGPVSGGAGPLFSAANPWTEAVDVAALHPQSSAMIAQLVALGGFGLGRFQVDFSLVVLEAPTGTPVAPFVQSPGYYTPDCDALATVPLPVGGAVEGQAGYVCDTSANDCHLLVVDRPAGRLVEVYQATTDVAGRVQGLCGVDWNLATAYPAGLRGDQCTSADAAGLPIAPLLFSADELAAGSIDHAIRFILPNARIRAGVFVHPASHAGAPSGPATTVPYGARLRLRADYPVARLPAGAQVVARALQRYGMLLADGGNVALTARDDRFTTHKWSEVGFDSHSLEAITAGDFEVVDSGPVIPLTYDCVRNGR